MTNQHTCEIFLINGSCFRATIFQIALRTQIFIIDLDAFSKDIVALSKFFEKLFLNKKIIKMGLLHILN